MRYHRPRGYSFGTCSVRSSRARICLRVAINLFFMPGFTDMETEVEALRAFLKKFPVHMIQTRNLNIDPDFYFDSIGFEESEAMGIRKLVGMLRRDFPAVELGYYNRAKETYGKGNTLD